jgi:hypothetical protein
MVAIVAQVPFLSFFNFFGNPVYFQFLRWKQLLPKFHFCLFPILWTPCSILKLIVLKVFLSLSPNNMFVDQLGARGTQTDILKGHYG